MKTGNEKRRERSRKNATLRGECDPTHVCKRRRDEIPSHLSLPAFVAAICPPANHRLPSGCRCHLDVAAIHLSTRCHLSLPSAICRSHLSLPPSIEMVIAAICPPAMCATCHFCHLSAIRLLSARVIAAICYRCDLLTLSVIAAICPPAMCSG